MNGIGGSIAQALLCMLTIAAIRAAIVLLGSKIGAILMGLPMIMFPLLAIQAWQGPPVTQAQTVGTIASLVALNLAFWVCWLPVPYGPVTALAGMGLSWFTTVALIFWTRMPDWAMSSALVLNGLFILVRYRDRHGTVLARRGRITDGAVVTMAFLIFFFLVTRLVPDFLRGVLVGFPVGAFAIVYFVHRVLSLEAYRDFVIYFQGAMLSNAMFVLFVHYSLMHMPIALALTAGLAASLGTTLIVGRIWRSPRVAQPPAGMAP